MKDRLAAVVDYKANREERAARDLRDALALEQQQRALVEEQKQKLAAERDVQLAWLCDLADARVRDVLQKAEHKLQQVERVVEDVRAQHRQAAVEHQVLLRLQERRKDEARKESDKREQRGFDEIAARMH